MIHTVQFIMGGKVHKLSDVDPRMTVLNWLRYECQKTGTKEGCAEGDCGACTVVLGALTKTGVHYKAVNACILFLPNLDGKELITVEDIAGPDGTLHEVQKQMVELHGSQCGFCTPGFVMSLYASYLTDEVQTEASINDTLAGNLCRCTGYGPIIEAAKKMGAAGFIERKGSARLDMLRSVQREETLTLKYDHPVEGPRSYFAPVTIDQFAQLYKAHPDAQILAGGTDIGLWVTKQNRRIAKILYIGDVKDCLSITKDENGLKIDAGVTYSAALDALTDYHPHFGELVRRIGSRQIRNSGTIGGNVANGSPIGDTMPALIAAGALVTLRCGKKRRSLPIEDYFLSYGKQDRNPSEFIESIGLPFLVEGRHFVAYKISKRFDQDISALCFAMSFNVENGKICSPRIAMGGMAAIPKRAIHTEDALLGQPWTEATIRKAMRKMNKDYAPLSDMRASAEYRMQVAQNLLLKAWLEVSGGKTSHVLAIREPANV